MTPITFVMSFLSLLAVLIAIGAQLVVRRGSPAFLSQQLKQQLERLESCEAMIATLARELRNERAARNMAAGRAKATVADLENAPTMSDEEKARARRELGATIQPSGFRK
jgi:cell division protein FtsB